MAEKLAVLLAFGISFFGLVSCKANSSGLNATIEDTPPPIVTPDSGVRQEALLEWKDGEKLKSESLRIAHRLPVDFAARIVFPDPAIVSAAVASECTTALGQVVERSAERREFKSDFSFPMIDLIPAVAWRQHQLARLETLNCEFKFELKNHAGSSWKVAVSSVTFVHPEHLVALSLPESFVNAWIPADKAWPIEFAELHPTNKETRYDLLCDHFANSRVSDLPLPDVMRDLISGTRPNTLAGPTDIDPRPRFGLQTCRLAIESRDREAGRTWRALSPLFAVRYPDSLHAISGSLSMPFGSSMAAAQNKDVVSMRIANSSTLTQAYRLYNSVSEALKIEVAMLSMKGFTVRERFPADVSYRWQGKAALHVETDSVVFELAPGESLSVYGAISHIPMCQWESSSFANKNIFALNLTPANEAESMLEVGNFLAFPKGKLLQKFLNWEPERRDFAGPTVEVAPFNFERSEDSTGVFTNWVPLTTWRDYSGSTTPRKTEIEFHQPSKCMDVGSSAWPPTRRN